MTNERIDLDDPSTRFTQATMIIPEGRDYKLMQTSRLVVVKGKDAGNEITVKKDRLSIGRSSRCDLVLDDRAVSSLHAELLTTPSGHLLRDANSTNGILFVGHRVNELQLKPGSQFQIGNNLLRFEPLDDHIKIPLSMQNHFGEALGRSVQMRAVFATLERVAGSALALLLTGETGTGKDVLARAVHAQSGRSHRSFTVLDCGAVPPKLMESSLFGHEKGAFTGAKHARSGVFEEAHGGTLFIDEIGELELGLQPKLLRVLEQQEVRRIGGRNSRKVDARIISATNRDLWQMVEKKSFREDLLYRLSVVEVRIPPLRDRPDDIPLLVAHFLKTGNQMRRDAGLPAVKLADDAMAVLQSHPWPGNVRELKNVVESTLTMAEGERVNRKDLQMDMLGGHAIGLGVDTTIPYKQAKARLLDKFDQHYLRNLLKDNDGNLSRAAKQAGLVRHHLRDLCKRHSVPCGAEASDAESSS